MRKERRGKGRMRDQRMRRGQEVKKGEEGRGKGRMRDQRMRRGQEVKKGQEMRPAVHSNASGN